MQLVTHEDILIKTDQHGIPQYYIKPQQLGIASIRIKHQKAAMATIQVKMMTSLLLLIIVCVDARTMSPARAPQPMVSLAHAPHFWPAYAACAVKCGKGFVECKTACVHKDEDDKECFVKCTKGYFECREECVDGDKKEMPPAVIA
ncbi:uncharacterized protein A4U43_C08F22240 [Asparagus officinalis]|nr:uncharacterized protein A4U43_C08F22240 [Asparagus officinalis]